MFVATVIVSAVLAALLVFSAAQKLGRSQQTVSSYQKVGVPAYRLPWLALILIVGAAALLIGLGVPPLGAAAAGGLTLYFALAVGSHLRHRELSNVATALVILLLSITALILRLGSA